MKINILGGLCMLKVLRVNMKTSNVSETEFDMNVRFGNRGLIAKTMTEEVNPRCEPLGEENKLIFATGIYAGYGYPTGNRLSVGSKSPLTGGIKESNVGGTMGTYLANHGIKEIIVEGISDKWSIIIIDEDGKLAIENADEYVGKGTYDTTDIMYEKYGKKIAACIIGQAGERMNSVASIQVLDHASGHPGRAAGRGGLGAVMGSKKIKAIIVKTPKEKAKLPAMDEEKLKKARIALTKNIAADPAAISMKNGGTNSFLDMMSELNILPVENFSGRLMNDEESSKLNSDVYEERVNNYGGKQGLACQPGCPVQCSNIVNDKDGNMVTVGLEYETIALAGPNCNIFDYDYLAYFDKACDDMGLDTMDVADAIAVAMDAGYIPWGDIEKAKEIIDEMYKGSEIGIVFANGTKSVGDYFKHDRVPQVKGQSFPAYDPRSIKGLGVTYATSTMGADHTAGHTLTASIDHAKPDFQVQTSMEMQVGACIIDNACCLFAGTSLFTPEAYEFAQAVFGDDISPEFLQNAGIQTIMMEKAFNTKAGITQKEDDLPEFFKVDKTQGTKTVFDVDQKEMDLMWLPEEYRTLHGFEIKTKIFSGEGKLKVVGELLDKYKAKNILLVYDEGLKKIGHVDKLKAHIDLEKYNLIEFDGVKADPPFATIKRAIEFIGDKKIDAAIAIGGGSSIDTAKAIVAVLKYPERPVDILMSGLPYDDRESIPLIAISTTSGTGSEVTAGGVITDTDGQKNHYILQHLRLQCWIRF